MTKKLEMYKCELCGNFVEVVLAGAGELVCCGQPMVLLEPNTTDAAGEKHVPFFVKKDNELEVRVGSVLHPMTDEHYIQFIEVFSKDERYVKRKYLYPNEEPIFPLKWYDIGALTAREFCNLHGLWEAKYD
ncbi:MAG: desulfoferrodoxin family protein [Candidatus Gastranaerophilales bacterium]|nr:desulfoferrodoxin family protein [Candidatus Gastranaerophilales bacterium]